MGPPTQESLSAEIKHGPSAATSIIPGPVVEIEGAIYCLVNKR